MKFTDGFWKTKACYDVKYIEQAYDIEHDEQSMTVYGTHCHINHRGQTLGGPLITVCYQAVRDGVIKVTMEHYSEAIGSYFEVDEDKAYYPTFTDTDEYIEMHAGSLSVRVNKGGGFCAVFYENGKRLTKSSWRNAAYITENQTTAMLKALATQNEGFWNVPEGQTTSYMREQLGMEVGEYVYGLGERFTAFVKNGQVIENWNADGGTSSDQSYKSIPFYISNRGYGVFVNHSEHVSFEIGTENVSHVQFSVPGESLEYYVIGGGDPKEVIKKYTSLTGKPALPPAWTFGLWLTTSFTTSYDEKTVNTFIDGMKERDIPLEVFHFDCFWMREFDWCNFKWDTRQFPDPEGMLRRLKEKGLKICVWINPYIGQRSELFAEGKANGYFIKNKNGTVFQCDEWQPGMAIVDFTNEEACKWYASKLEALVDMGVDCFKTDFGERIPTNVVYSNGADPMKMHNYYTQIYNQVVFDVLERKLGKNEAALFARSATAGGQKFPVHWGGDCSAQYVSMAESLRGGLSLCSSGFGFWSHDISGFEATATPDIYKRWSAFGLLSTHSRLHGNSSYRVPWLFDEEAVDVLRHFTKLKGKLMPYIFAQAVETHNTGIPSMRPMMMEFGKDPACDTLDRQYMLGDSLLVAPIFNEEGEVTYYLPKGRWTNLLTNEVIEGGRYITQSFDYFGLPLMVRENTLLPLGNFKESFSYNYLDELTIWAYHISDEAKCRVYDSNAEAFIDIVAKRDKKGLHITLTKEISNIQLIIRDEEDRVIDLSGKREVTVE